MTPRPARATRRRLALVGATAVLVGAAATGIAVVQDGGAASRVVATPAPARRVTDLATAARRAHAHALSTPFGFGVGVHVPGHVDYPTNPPIAGPHNPAWASDGSYAGAATPPAERLVHALEHGRIEIQYRPGLPASQVRELEGLFEESPEHVLLFANHTTMPGAVAVTAWGRGLVFPRFSVADLDAMRAFRDAFRDKGPELIPQAE